MTLPKSLIKVIKQVQAMPYDRTEFGNGASLSSISYYFRDVCKVFIAEHYFRTKVKKAFRERKALGNTFSSLRVRREFSARTEKVSFEKNETTYESPTTTVDEWDIWLTEGESHD